MTLTVIGETPEKLKVIKYDGFKWYSEQGLPLDIQFINLKERGLMPSWIHLYEYGLLSMPQKAVLSNLSESLQMAYGQDFKNEVMKRLYDYIAISSKNTDNDK